MKPLLVLDNVKSGLVQGSVTAKQLPDIPCAWVKIRALRSNAGNVYIGARGVTRPDGHTDTTTGFELDAGDNLEFIPIDNLNKLWMICDLNGDDISYIIFI